MPRFCLIEQMVWPAARPQGSESPASLSANQKEAEGGCHTVEARSEPAAFQGKSSQDECVLLGMG